MNIGPFFLTVLVMFNSCLIFRGLDDRYLKSLGTLILNSQLKLLLVDLIWSSKCSMWNAFESLNVNNTKCKIFFSLFIMPTTILTPSFPECFSNYFFVISGSTLGSNCNQNNLKPPLHGAKHFHRCITDCASI